MKILVVGAGAVGGYFGAKLAQAGNDVTFLVRAGRAAELETRGLRVISPLGDVVIEKPKTVQAALLREQFDVILLSCKAYDLPRCIEDFRPAVGPDTAIIPMLNGMQHLQALDKEFGQHCVFGGLAEISSTLNEHKDIVHLNTMHTLVLGAREAAMQSKARDIHAVFAGAGFDAQLADDVVQNMWEKWVFITSLAAITTLMRNALGHILRAPGGMEFVKALSGECVAVAQAHRHAPRPAFFNKLGAVLLNQDSMLTASMLRDMQAHSRIEADAVMGDMLRHAQAAQLSTPYLALAYTNAKAYELTL